MGPEGRIVFIIGGARSGKSSFALQRASALLGSKAYIATAQAIDDEMNERIEKHKQERPTEWITFEEPLNIGNLINNIDKQYNVVLIDCLTIWLSNLLFSNRDIQKEIEYLCSSLAGCQSSLFVVSNEVGMGIVPDNELSRRFRDMAGTLNQRIAEVADEVYLVTAGIPLKIKQEA